MLRILLIAVLVLAGCGDAEREAAAPRPAGTLEVRMMLAEGPLYAEGSVPVIDAGPIHAEPVVESLDEPVLREELPAGTDYRFEAVQRPCSGTCKHLDPPDEASRCDTRFGIAAGETTTVVIVLRGAPDGVAAECSVLLE